MLLHEYGLDHTSKKAAEPVDIELTTDGKITGKATGTWSITAGTSYITLKINNTYYHGVMVEQTLEPTDTKVPAFTAMAAKTGVSVWGYQTEATTGIEGVTDDISHLSPLVSPIFDLQGRKITAPQRKGIYIQNGKKYILK